MCSNERDGTHRHPQWSLLIRGQSALGVRSSSSLTARLTGRSWVGAVLMWISGRSLIRVCKIDRKGVSRDISTAEGGEEVADLVVDGVGIGEGAGDLLAEQGSIAGAEAMGGQPGRRLGATELGRDACIGDLLDRAEQGEKTGT